MENSFIGTSDYKVLAKTVPERRFRKMKRRYDFFFRRFILRKRRSGFCGLAKDGVGLVIMREKLVGGVVFCGSGLLLLKGIDYLCRRIKS